MPAARSRRRRTRILTLGAAVEAVRCYDAARARALRAGSRREAMKSTPAVYLFLIVCGLWLVWSGHYTPLVLSFGLASAVGVVLLCWRMRILDRDIAPLHTIPAMLRYFPWLAREVVKANLDVLGRVLRPSLPIDPQILHLRASQTTDLGRVTYTNSITLTPGTLTVDAVDDRLTIHAIAGEPAADLRAGRMDRKITSLEPED